MSDLTDATAAVTNLLNTFGATRDQFADILGGPVDGGPNNDGLYPATNASGTTKMVPSVAKYQAEQDAFMSLVHAALATVAVQVFDTLANLNASPAPVAGTQARVYADPEPAKNGIYLFSGGQWALDNNFSAQLAAYVSPLVTQAQTAASNAQTSATQVAGAAGDATSARSLIERLFAVPIALPINGDPNNIAFSSASGTAPADQTTFEILIAVRNTGAVTLNAAGVVMPIVHNGSGSALAAGELVPGTIVKLQRSVAGGGVALVLGSRALTIPGAPTATDLANVTTVANATETTVQSLLGVPFAVPVAGNVNNIAYAASTDAAPADQATFEVVVVASNTGATTINAAGVVMRVAHAGTGSDLAAGELVGGSIQQLTRSVAGGNVALLGSRRTLSIAGAPSASDLASVVATASGTETAFESLLGVPVAIPAPDADNLRIAGSAPTDQAIFEAYIAVANTAAPNITKGGLSMRVVANGGGALPSAGALVPGTIQRFQYSQAGAAFIMSGSRTPTFNATLPAPNYVASQDASLVEQPWGTVTFPNGGHATITPTTQTITVIGSSNEAYPATADKPSTLLVNALNAYTPGTGTTWVADAQAVQGAPWAAAGGQLNDSTTFMARKSRYVVSVFGMNEARTINYHDYGGLPAQEQAIRDSVSYIRSMGAEPVLNTIFHCDPRNTGELNPTYFSDNPTRDMAYPAYKSHPVDPNLDMVPAGNALSTEPIDWTGGGVLRTGSIRNWHVNRMIRAVAAELGCMLLDFEWSCFRNCIETVPDLSDGLNTYYQAGNPLHPLPAMYQQGVAPVMRQFARAMLDGRNDIRVFRGV